MGLNQCSPAPQPAGTQARPPCPGAVRGSLRGTENQEPSAPPGAPALLLCPVNASWARGSPPTPTHASTGNTEKPGKGGGSPPQRNRKCYPVEPEVLQLSEPEVPQLSEPEVIQNVLYAGQEDELSLTQLKRVFEMGPSWESWSGDHPSKSRD